MCECVIQLFEKNLDFIGCFICYFSKKICQKAFPLRQYMFKYGNILNSIKKEMKLFQYFEGIAFMSILSIWLLINYLLLNKGVSYREKIHFEGFH